MPREIDQVVGKHIIRFTDKDAIQKLPPGMYEGEVEPTTYHLGDNGSDKTWYAVRVTDGDPTVVGTLVNVGIVAANVSIEVSAWIPGGAD